ncbi:MAG: signal peptide prediction [Burkholderiales bacterium]|nr:signal peptide prediction [Burkholderiales bacterium]
MPPGPRAATRGAAAVNAIWRRLWAGPWTLLGLLLGALAWTCGARWRRRDGAIEVAGGTLGRWIEDGRHGLRAMTLGHVVLGCSAAWLDALSEHERVHVRQYERWGPLFVPAYFAAGAWAALRGGDAYRDNRFEREALRAEAAARRQR